MKNNTYITEKLKEITEEIWRIGNRLTATESEKKAEIKEHLSQDIQEAIEYGERRERERMKGIFNLMADTMGVIDIPKLTNSREEK